VDVDDDAAWARVYVIPFPISHLGHEDKRRKLRLARSSNLQGILRWAVEGAGKWYATEQGLQAPETVKSSTQAQRGTQDFVQQFLDEMTEDKPNVYTNSGVLWSFYEDWCKDNGVPAKYQNQFSQALNRKGYAITRARVNGTLRRVIKGLQIIDKSVTRDAP
jgi:putative DNA primase/helicase